MVGAMVGNYNTIETYHLGYHKTTLTAIMVGTIKPYIYWVISDLPTISTMFYKSKLILKQYKIIIIL
jgi:hypothetical protein